MRSRATSNYFTYRREAVGRIWGEFSCSRILFEFASSSHNFRFQTFEPASVSNLLKAQLRICQQTQS